ncbi:MAG: thioredoxin [Myxococcota bacterium]
MATQTITQENIETTVNDNDIVVFDFWASWCGPCRMFAPVFEEASERHDDIVFGKIDTEAQQQLAMQLQIQSIPTLMVFREKVLVFRQPGALNKDQFESLLEEVKKLDMDEVRAEIAKQQTAQGEQSATDA